jgi:hypothetical protein
VLHELLSSHSELIPDARRAANALLASVSFAAVAESILDALAELGLDDLAAGPHAGGYVEASEAAWEAIEQAVAPYDDLTPAVVSVRTQQEKGCPRTYVLETGLF